MFCGVVCGVLWCLVPPVENDVKVKESLIACQFLRILLQHNKIREMVCVCQCSPANTGFRSDLRKEAKIYMSLIVRKPVFGVSDQVPHKPGCTAEEDG